MSMTDTDPSVAPPPGAGGGPPGAGGGPPGAGGSPQAGGGPVLAALARQRMSPPVSAPGPGDMAKALMTVKTAVDMLQSALPALGTGGPQHKDVLNAITRLSRHLPQGQPTAGAQQSMIGDLLRATMRNALMQKLMQQKQGGPGGGGGGPPATPDGGGGEMPPGGDQSPPPSTPMPGA